MRNTTAVNTRLALRQSPLTWVVLAANLLIWLAMEASGGSTDTDVLVLFGAKVNFLITNGEVWRLFTAMFLHIGFWHLLVNAYSLYNMGTLLEPLLGTPRFVAVYVLSGLCGSLASYQFNPHAISAGASGAIFGLVGAVGVFFFTHRKVFGEVSTRMVSNIAFIALINLAFGLRAGGVDNYGHMGGLAGGIVLGALLSPRYGGIFMDRPQLFVRDGNPLRAWLFALIFALALAGATGLAILSKGDSAEWHLERGAEFYLDDRHQEAVAEFQKALERDPSLSRAHFYLGLIAYDRGDYLPASQAFESVVRLDQKNASAHYNLGLCYQELGRYAEARTQFQQTLQYAGNDSLRARAGASLRALEGK